LPAAIVVRFNYFTPREIKIILLQIFIVFDNLTNTYQTGGIMLELVGSNGQGEELSRAQETAMQALRAGSTFVQAAKLSGVNRATVYRWVQNNPAFRAAYNTWQRELTESARSRLLKLSELAVSVVEKALLDDDRKVAVKMLRDLGVMRGRKHGSMDAEVLQLQMELKHKQAHQKATVAMLDLLLAKAGAGPEQRKRIIEGREAIPASRTRGESDPAGHAAPDATTNATTDATPSDAGGDAAGDPVGAAGDNAMPLQEIQAFEAGLADVLADATDSATFEGAPQDLAAEQVA
jgi:hypothetical protein